MPTLPPQPWAEERTLRIYRRRDGSEIGRRET